MDVSDSSRLQAADGWPGPLIVPVEPGAPLDRWVADRRPWLDSALLEHGAVLFRGAGVDSAGTFLEVCRASCGQLLDYVYRSTPRTALERYVYTATEYRSDAAIPMHNENAYQRDWPMRLAFCCLQPAASGGETPLAYMPNVTRRIGADVVRTFGARGVKYVRNYGGAVDLSWETAFQTESKAEVEAYCRRESIEWTWLPDEGLRTAQVCQAVATHPATGAELWFNQAHLFHVSSLPASDREAMLEVFGEAHLPRNAYFGDGEALDEGVLGHVRQAFDQESSVFTWEKGDVLIVDNMLVAHGRRPFTGTRQVLVAMADSFSVCASVAGGRTAG